MANHHNRLAEIACIAVLVCAVLFPSRAHAATEYVRLQFGVYQSDKATVMYRKFLPVIERLTEATEVELGRPVDIEFKIFRTYQDAQESLAMGTVDFTRFGPASYVLAKDRNPEVGLLAREARKAFKCVIAVPHASQAKVLKDLAGLRFGFGDRDSTCGRYASQARLAKAGVYASDFSAFEYLDRHDRVFRAVEFGDFDAGALKVSTYRKLNSSGQLRILDSFEIPTKPWPVRAGLDPEIRQALQKALLGIDDPEVLKTLGVTGFGPVADADFDHVREWMRGLRRIHRTGRIRRESMRPAPAFRLPRLGAKTSSRSFATS